MADLARDYGVDPKGSSLFEYRCRTVGGGGLMTLLGYEFWSIAIADVSGALGYLLRRLFIRLILKRRSIGLVLSRHVTFRGCDRVNLGDFLRIDEGCSIDCFPLAKGIEIDDETMLERNVVLSTGPLPDARLKLGKRVSVGVGTVMVAHGGIEIGDRVMIGPLCYITAGSHVHDRIDLPMVDQGLRGQGVRIEDDVWIGAGVIVLDKVTIHKGAIIGAGAVVTRDVPPRAIVAGVPARAMRERSAS